MGYTGVAWEKRGTEAPGKVFVVLFGDFWGVDLF